MVMEKALPQLPTELVKLVEEFAGIYRQPDYKNIIDSLEDHPYYTENGGKLWDIFEESHWLTQGTCAIHSSICWKEWLRYRLSVKKKSNSQCWVETQIWSKWCQMNMIISPSWCPKVTNSHAYEFTPEQEMIIRNNGWNPTWKFSIGWIYNKQAGFARARVDPVSGLIN